MMPSTFAYFNGNMQDVLVLAVMLLMFLPSVFWVVEIIDVLRRRFDDPNMKITWLLVVCLLHFLGAVIYFFIGKKQGTIPR